MEHFDDFPSAKIFLSVYLLVLNFLVIWIAKIPGVTTVIVCEFAINMYQNSQKIGLFMTVFCIALLCKSEIEQ